MLAMDEEAFPARGQHPDAEARKLAVSDVVNGLAGSERPDAGLGKGDLGHVSFFRLRLQPGNGPLQNPFPEGRMRE